MKLKLSVLAVATALTLGTSAAFAATYGSDATTTTTTTTTSTNNTPTTTSTTQQTTKPAKKTKAAKKHKTHATKPVAEKNDKAQDMEGPYLGAAIGFGQVDTNFDNNIGFAYQFKAGYLSTWGLWSPERLGIVFGPEVAWTGYPSPSGNNSGGNVNSVDLTAVAKFVFLDDWNVNAKFGMAIQMISDMPQVGNTTNVQPLIGFGLGYDLDALTGVYGLYANADFQYAFGDKNNVFNRGLSAYAILFGVTYIFDL